MQRKLATGGAPRSLLVDLGDETDDIDMLIAPVGEVKNNDEDEVDTLQHSDSLNIYGSEEEEGQPQTPPNMISDDQCVCGNFFMSDSRFCRRCGQPRPEHIALSKDRCHECSTPFARDVRCAMHTYLYKLL